MSRFSKAMSVVVACLIPCLAFGAGDTPISNLKLTSNANGGNFAFTNLSLVAATSMTVSTTATSGTQVVNWKAMTNYVAAFAGGLTTNSSPTMAPGTVWTFSLANVTNNADSGTEVVNWQTMTGHVASATSGFLTNGQANVNFGTNLMVRGNPVLTNETLWLAFAATGGVVNGSVTVHGDTWLDGNVYVSQTLYVTNMYVTNIWTTITNLYVQGDGVITGDLTVSNVFRAGTIYGSMDATNIVNAPWLTNGQSGVTFGSLSVTSNATSGQQVVNWQTLTNAIATLAPIPAGVITNGQPNVNLGTNLMVAGVSVVTNPVAGRISVSDTQAWWTAYLAITNTRLVSGTAPGFIYADANTNLSYSTAPLTNGSVAGSLSVTSNATAGQQVVNWRTMTNYLASIPPSTPSLQQVTLVGSTTTNEITAAAYLGSWFGTPKDSSATGTNNAYFGLYAGIRSVGTNNQFFGYAAGADSSGRDNTYVGYYAGSSSKGQGSTFVGANSGSDSVGENNSHFGIGAGQGSVSSNSTYVGNWAGRSAGGIGWMFIDNYVSDGLSSGATNNSIVIDGVNSNMWIGRPAGSTTVRGLVLVPSNAWTGTMAVNWQTMTGYVASATGSFITNGSAGTWTNLAAYYNDAGFVSNGQANVNFASLTVNGNTVVTNPVAGRITDSDTNAWWAAYAASTNTAVIGGSAPGFIFADANTNLSYLMALTNGASGVNFASLTVAFNATGNTQVVNYQTMTNYVVAGFVDIPTFQNHTNNLDADVLHMTAAEKLLATNVINILDGTNTTVRTLGTTGIVVDVNIGTNGLHFASDCKLMMTTNNTLGVWYLNGGVWSNAFEVTR